jgi:hypothetical protein
MAHRKKGGRPEALNSHGAAIKNLRDMSPRRTLKENELMSTEGGDIWIGACMPCSAIVFRVDRKGAEPLKVGWHMDPTTISENMLERRAKNPENVALLSSAMKEGKKVKHVTTRNLRADEIVAGVAEYLKEQGGKGSRIHVEISKGRASFGGEFGKGVQRAINETHAQVLEVLRAHQSITNVKTKRPSEPDNVYARQYVRVPQRGKSNHRIVIQGKN